MDDNERAEKMAEPLRDIYDDTASRKLFVAAAQDKFRINTFTANLVWWLIDSA